MKKIITLTIAIATMLVGCGTEPQMFGNVKDWSQLETKDFHVIYAVGDEGVYSDGSPQSNRRFNNWVKRYNEIHN